MARLFDITTTTDSLALDERGGGRIVFTVTNTTQRPQRATLKAVAMDSGQSGWLKITGETERDFAPGFTHQVEVVVTAAGGGGAPLEKFRLRLDAISVANPDDDYVSSSLISVVPKAAPAPAKKDGMPWWVWLVIALVALVVIGAVGYLVSHRKPADITPPPPASSPPSVPSNPPPQPPTVEYNDPRIQVGGENLALDVCREWGNNCGKPAADQYCINHGQAGAVDFRIAMDSPPTAIVSSNQVCREPGCDRITWVKCSAGRQFVFQLNPATVQMMKALPAKGKNLP